jgi:16S rRNA (guanine966-N2)-methyltransferase
VRIIAGEWGGRRLAPLKGRSVRPTTDRVREAWMSAMGGRLDGMVVVDLFAGSGALGLECLSRGAEHVTFVEKAGSSLRVLRRNVETLGAGSRCTIVQADVFAWLGDLPPSAHDTDVALADPPYGEGFAERLVERYLMDPFAKALWVEHGVRDSIPEAPGLRQRRYGDTVLSRLSAEP